MRTGIDAWFFRMMIMALLAVFIILGCSEQATQAPEADETGAPADVGGSGSVWAQTEATDGWINRLLYCIIGALMSDEDLVRVADVFIEITEEIISEGENGLMPSGCITAIHAWADTTRATTLEEALGELGYILDENLE